MHIGPVWFGADQRLWFHQQSGHNDFAVCLTAIFVLTPFYYYQMRQAVVSLAARWRWLYC